MERGDGKRCYVYVFETPSGFFGRLLGQNVDEARKLLRIIMKRRVLPAKTDVYRLKGVA